MINSKHSSWTRKVQRYTRCTYEYVLERYKYHYYPKPVIIIRDEPS